MRNTAIGDSASKPRSLVSCKLPVISLKSKSDNFNRQIYRFFAIWQFISAGIVQKNIFWMDIWVDCRFLFGKNFKKQTIGITFVGRI